MPAFPSALSRARELPGEREHHRADDDLKKKLGRVRVVPPPLKSRAERVEHSVESEKKYEPTGYIDDKDATQETDRTEYRSISAENRSQRYDAQRNYRSTVEERDRCENQKQCRHVCKPCMGEKCTAALDSGDALE
ncbi:MAG: hypothetical protein BMS9Abin37_2806 [Acidobacteriota bacterium]|nr:MAG: hypothetical protein BMS9Abin37_2806 [Acidobacteriota bacterium]